MSRYGCRFVSVKIAARVLRVEQETIMLAINDIPWRGKHEEDGSRTVLVQIPATRRALVRMAEDALRRLDNPSHVDMTWGATSSSLGGR